MSGPQLGGKSCGRKTVLDDGQVRMARFMSERESVPKAVIAEKFGVDLAYIGKVLSYEVCSRVYID